MISNGYEPRITRQWASTHPMQLSVTPPTADDKKDATEKTRFGKPEFLRAVAARADVPLGTTERVYDALLAIIVEAVRDHGKLVLTGFGRFYSQIHKGHRVQFAGSEGRIPDYPILKFSATRRSNEVLAGALTDSVATAGGHDAH